MQESSIDYSRKFQDLEELVRGDSLPPDTAPNSHPLHNNHLGGVGSMAGYSDVVMSSKQTDLRSSSSCSNDVGHDNGGLNQVFTAVPQSGVDASNGQY